MVDISLRWQLLFFFCILGLLPQIAISYFSIDAYTRSLEQTYDHQVSQLVQQAAEQTSTSAQNLLTDLQHEATQPYIQLSFQQYPQTTRLQLLQERLELYRVSRDVYTRLDLCYLNGENLVSTSGTTEGETFYTFEKEAITNTDIEENAAFQQLFPGGKELALFVPVSSFRQPAKTVGFMVAYLPISTFTVHLEKLDFGKYVEERILTAAGRAIKKDSGQHGKLNSSSVRTYGADIESLNWKIEVTISEDELFHDVIALKHTTTLFIAAIIIFAFTASFVFSHKFTRPFGKIIAGTRSFAKGELEHHIEVESGHEAKQLAAAFNDMAHQLDARQNELNQAVRLASLGIMTAGIGHEIKNPLAGIKTSSQVINRLLTSQKARQDDTTPIDHLEEIAELAQGISEESDRLTKILNDLLQLGKPRKPQLVSFDLNETVSHVVAVIQPEFAKKHVKTEVRMHPVTVVADPDQILQVLLNLLLNSLEAVAPNTGRVKIKLAKTTDGAVILKIIDNGSGIAKDKLQHIFDPFFSLRKEGTGLGLSIVYTLLKQNNASIQVSSELDKGTEFEIAFTCRNIQELTEVND